MNYFWREKQFEDYNKTCEKLYKDIYNKLQSELSEKLEFVIKKVR